MIVGILWSMAKLAIKLVSEYKTCTGCMFLFCASDSRALDNALGNKRFHPLLCNMFLKYSNNVVMVIPKMIVKRHNKHRIYAASGGWRCSSWPWYSWSMGLNLKTLSVRKILFFALCLFFYCCPITPCMVSLSCAVQEKKKTHVYHASCYQFLVIYLQPFLSTFTCQHAQPLSRICLFLRPCLNPIDGTFMYSSWQRVSHSMYFSTCYSFPHGNNAIQCLAEDPLPRIHNNNPSLSLFNSYNNPSSLPLSLPTFFFSTCCIYMLSLSIIFRC